MADNLRPGEIHITAGNGETIGIIAEDGKSIAAHHLYLLDTNSPIQPKPAADSKPLPAETAIHDVIMEVLEEYDSIGLQMARDIVDKVIAKMQEIELRVYGLSPKTPEIESEPVNVLPFGIHPDDIDDLMRDCSRYGTVFLKSSGPDRFYRRVDPRMITPIEQNKLHVKGVEYGTGEYCAPTADPPTPRIVETIVRGRDVCTHCPEPGNCGSYEHCLHPELKHTPTEEARTCVPHGVRNCEKCAQFEEETHAPDVETDSLECEIYSMNTVSDRLAELFYLVPDEDKKDDIAEILQQRGFNQQARRKLYAAAQTRLNEESLYDAAIEHEMYGTPTYTNVVSCVNNACESYHKIIEPDNDLKVCASCLGELELVQARTVKESMSPETTADTPDMHKAVRSVIRGWTRRWGLAVSLDDLDKFATELIETVADTPQSAEFYGFEPEYIKELLSDVYRLGGFFQLAADPKRIVNYAIDYVEECESESEADDSEDKTTADTPRTGFALDESAVLDALRGVRRVWATDDLWARNGGAPDRRAMDAFMNDLEEAVIKAINPYEGMVDRAIKDYKQRTDFVWTPYEKGNTIRIKLDGMDQYFRVIDVRPNGMMDLVKVDAPHTGTHVQFEAIHEDMPSAAPRRGMFADFASVWVGGWNTHREHGDMEPEEFMALLMAEYRRWNR